MSSEADKGKERNTEVYTRNVDVLCVSESGPTRFERDAMPDRKREVNDSSSQSAWQLNRRSFQQSSICSDGDKLATEL